MFGHASISRAYGSSKIWAKFSLESRSDPEPSGSDGGIVAGQLRDGEASQLRFRSPLPANGSPARRLQQPVRHCDPEVCHGQLPFHLGNDEGGDAVAYEVVNDRHSLKNLSTPKIKAFAATERTMMPTGQCRFVMVLCRVWRVTRRSRELRPERLRRLALTGAGTEQADFDRDIPRLVSGAG